MDVAKIRNLVLQIAKVRVVVSAAMTWVTRSRHGLPFTSKHVTFDKELVEHTSNHLRQNREC